MRTSPYSIASSVSPDGYCYNMQYIQVYGKSDSSYTIGVNMAQRHFPYAWGELLPQSSTRHLLSQLG